MKFNNSASQVQDGRILARFSRDDIAYFIQQYQIKATKKDVQDEEAWFDQLFTLCSSKANESLVSNARSFMEQTHLDVFARFYRIIQRDYSRTAK